VLVLAYLVKRATKIPLDITPDHLVMCVEGATFQLPNFNTKQEHKELKDAFERDKKFILNKANSITNSHLQVDDIPTY
jgi:hypothetical protein